MHEALSQRAVRVRVLFVVGRCCSIEAARRRRNWHNNGRRAHLGSTGGGSGEGRSAWKGVVKWESARYPANRMTISFNKVNSCHEHHY